MVADEGGLPTGSGFQIIACMRGAVIWGVLAMGCVRPALAPVAAPPAAPAPLPAHTRILSGGLRLVVVEDRSRPAVVAALVLPAGSTLDPEGQEGLAWIAAGVAAAGRPLRAETSHDDALLTAQASAGGAGVEALVSGVLAALDAPTDLATRLPEVRADLERELRATADLARPGPAQEALFRGAFPDGHPYARATAGSAETRARIQAEDVQGFLAAHYRLANATLVLAGAVAVDDAERSVARALDARPPRAPAEAVTPGAARRAHGSPAPRPTFLRVRGPAPRLHLAWALPDGEPAPHALGPFVFLEQLERGLRLGQSLSDDVLAFRCQHRPGALGSIAWCEIDLMLGDHPGDTARQLLAQLPSPGSPMVGVRPGQGLEAAAAARLARALEPLDDRASWIGRRAARKVRVASQSIVPRPVTLFVDPTSPDAITAEGPHHATTPWARRDAAIAAAPAMTRTSLPSGLRVLAARTGPSGLASVGVALSGVSDETARLATEAMRFALRTDARLGSLALDVSHRTAGGRAALVLTGPAAALEELLELVARQVLVGPTERRAVAWTSGRELKLQPRLRRRLDLLARQRLAELLFERPPPASPFLSPGAVGPFDADALEAWRARALDPSRMVLAVAGDVDPAHVARLAGELLASLRRPVSARAAAPSLPSLPARRRVEVLSRPVRSPWQLHLGCRVAPGGAAGTAAALAAAYVHHAMAGRGRRVDAEVTRLAGEAAVIVRAVVEPGDAVATLGLLGDLFVALASGHLDTAVLDAAREAVETAALQAWARGETAAHALLELALDFDDPAARWAEQLAAVRRLSASQLSSHLAPCRGGPQAVVLGPGAAVREALAEAGFAERPASGAR